MGRIRLVIPGEQLIAIDLKIDGKPYVGVINRGLANFSHKDVFGWYLSLIIDYDKTAGEGMPDEEDTLKMQDFYDCLAKGLEGSPEHPNVLFLGRVTGDGYTEIMWYANDPETAHEYLQRVIEEKTYPFEFDYEIKADLSWSKADYWLKIL